MAHHESYWNATAPASDFPALEGEIEADVAVIGGGIVGVTTARMLTDRGLKVALVEARRVGEEVTGKSTAKITSQHNIAYTIIEKKFGEEGARLYAEANETGVRTICELAARHGIACNLERKHAFTYTRDDDEVERIEAEAGLADPPRPARLADPRHRPAVRGESGDALGRPGAIPSDPLCEGARRDPARRRLPGVRAIAGDRLGPAPDRDRPRRRQGAPRGDGDPLAARPDRPVLRRGLSAHASGDHGPRRSGAGAARHVHQRRNAAPFDARPSRRRGPGVDDLHRPLLQARPCRRGARELRGSGGLRRATQFGVGADYRWTNEDYTPMDHAPVHRLVLVAAATAIWSRPASTPGASPTAPPPRS